MTDTFQIIYFAMAALIFFGFMIKPSPISWLKRTYYSMFWLFLLAAALVGWYVEDCEKMEARESPAPTAPSRD